MGKWTHSEMSKSDGEMTKNDEEIQESENPISKIDKPPEILFITYFAAVIHLNKY